MSKTIYQTRGGVKVQLTASDVKAYVMKERGWSSQQYQKEYDKLRNRIRAYEAYQRAHGAQIEAQSPAHVLYFESRARKREGTEYRESLELQRIKSFPAISSGKALVKSLETNDEGFTRRYVTTSDKAFAGLIRANETAARIYREVPDPVKREQALKDFAKKLHLKMKQSGEAEAAAAIPFGQSIGSDEAIDFDIESYL